ncbi:Hexaprenyldihydroxybenzoate methyltransferase, mitochondrial [Entophlyctis luteolus]|nr:Hexaprenyldihydroxybenzoate methyltransferase, mitochondrial [Entophlyctis luteolus]
MNPVRVRYIRNQIQSNKIRESSGKDVESLSLAFPFSNLRIVDVGCGGGLLSESLARLGANVTGIDAAVENVAMATHHARLDPSIKGTLNFKSTTADELAKDEESAFDAVCSLEVIEHVNDPKQFVQDCMRLLKPNGLAVFSTINRTALSYLYTIFLAEQVLRWVPPGTHNHEKYVTPQELREWATHAGGEVVDVTGMHFDPLLNSWEASETATGSTCEALRRAALGGGAQVNYLMAVRKLPQ